MDLEKFNQLAANTKLAASSIEAAKAVLIHGKSPSVVASQAGVSRQAVYGYIHRILTAGDPKIDPNEGKVKVRIDNENYYLLPDDIKAIKNQIKQIIRGYSCKTTR